MPPQPRKPPSASSHSNLSRQQPSVGPSPLSRPAFSNSSASTWDPPPSHQTKGAPSTIRKLILLDPNAKPTPPSKSASSSSRRPPSTSSKSKVASKETGNVSKPLRKEETAKRSQVVVCGCRGTQHRLLYNCLSCGYIQCQKEGRGVCAFCLSSNTENGEMAPENVVALQKRLLKSDQARVTTRIHDEYQDDIDLRWTHRKGLPRLQVSSHFDEESETLPCP